MNPVSYALFAYVLTAVISFVVTGIIVVINHVMSHSDRSEEN
jgi:hypothetical protein